MDHVNNYKPPKENEKLDDETKLLHKEGCAPKLQIPIEQIKRELAPVIVGGVRLPPRLPIKIEPESKRKKVLRFNVKSVWAFNGC